MTEPDEISTEQPPAVAFAVTSDLVQRSAVVAATVLGAYLVFCAVLAVPISALSDAGLGVGGTLKAIVVLAATGLHGALFLKASDNTESFFNGSLTYVFVPFLVLGAALSLAFLAARRAEASAPSGSMREALARSGISSAVATAALAVLAGFSHLTLSENGFGGGREEAVVGAAIVPLLVWGIPLLFLAFGAGHLSQTLPRTAGVSLRTWLAQPTRGLSGWFGASALHLAVSSVGLAIGGIVYGLATSENEIRDSTGASLSSDVAGFLAFLAYLPNLAVAASGFFMGFSVGTGGVGSFFAGRDSFGLLHGDLPSAQYLWVLIPLAAAALVGVRHAVQEGPPASLTDDWWRAGVGSVLLWLPVTILVKVGIGGSLGGATFGLGYTAVSWVPLAFGWGVLLLVLGRALAGPLAAKAPALATRLGQTPAVEPGPVLPGSVLPSAAGLAGPALSRRTKVISAVVLGSLVLGTVAFKVVDAKAFGPSSAAEDYLHALEAGDVREAMSLRTDDDSTRFFVGDTPDSTLLDGASLPQGRRITNAKVVSIERRGSRAEAKVTYQVGGALQRDTLELRQHGRRAGVFHGWQVVGGQGALSVSVDGADDVLVNGVPVRLSNGRADLLALPGQYLVTLPETPVLSLDSPPVVVTLDNSGDLQGNVELSDSARTQAIEATTAYLTACLEKATTLDTPCGFSSFQFGDSYEKVRWALDGTPSFEVDYSDGQIDVRSTSPVEAMVTGIAVQQGFFGSPAKRETFTDRATNYVSGHIDTRSTPYVFVED